MRPLLVAGMEWPARCVLCGLVTEDPDAYVITSADEDAEHLPDHGCAYTGWEHAWASGDDVPLVTPREEGAP